MTNNPDEVQQWVYAIQPVTDALDSQIQMHLDNLTKPLGSLGRLEDIAMQYCRARNTVKPRMQIKRVVTFAADHGIAEEGVSAFPASVTPQMVLNMLSGGAAINVFCRHVGAQHRVVDIGVNHNFDNLSDLIDSKVRKGTRNFLHEPAMTAPECISALKTGVYEAELAVQEAVDLLAIGEMGIGNSTAAAALTAALLPCAVEDATGRGTGIADAQWRHKVSVIQRAMKMHSIAAACPFEILCCVGGLEIAGMTGLILGACANRLPVVIDGFIASAAALVALRLAPSVQDYLFFSHRSAEAGHTTFFDSIASTPLLNLSMRLGEGTGATLAMGLIEASIRMYSEMATFESASVDGAVD